MPLDALPQVNALARLGIIPIPDHIIALRKSEVLRECHLLYPTRIEMIRWQTISLGRGERLIELLATVMTVHAIGADKSAAPADIVALARDVDHSIENAAFTLDYCYIDPILYVADGLDGRLPLAIWEHGRTIAIAQRERALVPATGWFDRIFRRR